MWEYWVFTEFIRSVIIPPSGSSWCSFGSKSEIRLIWARHYCRGAAWSTEVNKSTLPDKDSLLEVPLMSSCIVRSYDHIPKRQSDVFRHKQQQKEETNITGQRCVFIMICLHDQDQPDQPVLWHFSWFKFISLYKQAFLKQEDHHAEHDIGPKCV